MKSDLKKYPFILIQVFKNCQMHRANGPREPFLLISYLSHHPQGNSIRHILVESLIFSRENFTQKANISFFFYLYLCLTLN